MQKSVVFLFFLCSSLTYAVALKNPYVYKSDKRTGYRQIMNKAMVCPYSMIAPFTGDLVIESKYDQSDKTKSTLRQNPDYASLQKKQAIEQFYKTLIRYSDDAVYAESSETRAVALRCLHDSLNAWAKAAALVDVETSKTGIAIRKWFLSAIASGLLKLEATYADFELTEPVEKWLAMLARQVHKDYQARFVLRGKAMINNHDYWAAWSVAAFAVLSNDEPLLAWSESVFRYALTQTRMDKKGVYGYLPNEIARGSLAADYSNYALIPLLFLADLLSENGKNIDAEREKLKALALFASRYALKQDVESVRDIVNSHQIAVKNNKLIWVFPYRKLFSASDLPVYKILEHEKYTSRYSLVGGELKAFYWLVP